MKTKAESPDALLYASSRKAVAPVGGEKNLQPPPALPKGEKNDCHHGPHIKPPSLRTHEYSRGHMCVLAHHAQARTYTFFTPPARRAGRGESRPSTNAVVQPCAQQQHVESRQGMCASLSLIIRSYRKRPVAQIVLQTGSGNPDA